MYYVLGMKKNLFSVSQLTLSGNCLVQSWDVKVYPHLKISKTLITKGWRLKSVYVLPAESAYIDKAQRNEAVNLWHDRLGYVSYHNL